MPTDYGWLVTSRSNVQEILLELYVFIRDQRSELEKRQAEWLMLGLLVGAAFSLWRAAFLSDADRQPANVIKTTEEFLEVLIRDNAINYPQDWKARAWTVGYYLNGARYRLQGFVAKLEQCGTRTSRPEILRIEELRTGDMVNPVEIWDELFHATVAAFAEFRTHWDRGTTSTPSPSIGNRGSAS